MPELEISRIHDAYALDVECPICDVMAVADNAYVKSFRGGRVMAPEVRVATNRSGFCPTHFERLYRGEGKLGLSLMVHTHLEHSVPGLVRELERVAKAPVPPDPTEPVVRRLWSRRRRRVSEVATLAASLRKQVESCFICDMLAKDLDRYCYTVLYLWQRDAGFPGTLHASRGFCLSHYASILEKAERMLEPSELARWLRETVGLMTESLRRLEGEVLAFSKRYHHTSPSGQRRDEERTALSRAIQKLSGRPLRLESGIGPGPAEDQDQDSLTPPPRAR